MWVRQMLDASNKQPPSSPPPPPHLLDEFYYLRIGPENVGPVKGFTVKSMIEAKSVNAATYIAKVGESQWTLLGAMPLFSALFNSPRAATGTGSRYAGFWVRAGAYLIDLVVINIAAFLIAFIIAFVGAALTGSTGDTGFISLIGVLVAIAYYIYFGSGKWQATPGKRALGIYIVRTDGAPISGTLAFGRYLSYVLSGLPLGLGFLMVGWSDENKALHDMICGTRVVYGKL